VKVEERNKNALYIVNTRIEYAKTLTESYFSAINNKPNIDNILRDLIEVNANGFRGVVLTALVGMVSVHSPLPFPRNAAILAPISAGETPALPGGSERLLGMQLNSQYDPLKNFYGCNPRSIFEQGIWYSLTEHNIPCGKSDPLNVAKNIQELNESWARGRRPQSAAMAAVKFLREIVSTKSTEERALLENYFYFKLVKYADSISKIKIKEVAVNAFSKQETAIKLSKFALENPESGAIPQLLIGKLIKTLFSSSSLTIYGDDESVFGTNTTSKKPADIWIKYDDKIIILFEITVKKIDLKRLDDCVEALSNHGIANVSVTFICRFPEDISLIPGLDTNANYFIYKNKLFEFVDFSDFVKCCFALLSQYQASNITTEIRKFIVAVTTSVKTKHAWNKIFSD